MERSLEKWGRATARHPWLTILTWIVTVIVLFVVATASGGAFLNEFNIPGSQSQKASDLAQEHFKDVGAVSADVVWHVDGGSLKDPANATAIHAVVADYAAQKGVRSASDPLAAGATISSDGRTAISSVQYTASLQDLPKGSAKRLDTAAGSARKAGVGVEFRGQVIDVEAQPESGSSEIVGVVAALVILLIAFGSVVAAGLPIIVALTGLAAGTSLVLIAGTAIDIPAIAPLVAVMLGLGAGVDYALFVVTRFRQYLAEGMAKEDAVGRALGSAGHAVLFAGGTVVVAILGLLLTGIPFIGGTGVAAALSVIMTAAAALSLLPAILGLLGHRVNALRLRRRRRRRNQPASDPAGPQFGGWSRWIGAIQRHRWIYAGGAVVVLLVLTAPLLSLRMGTPDDGTSPKDTTQYKAYTAVAKAFGAGYNAPLVVVADLKNPDGADRIIQNLSSEIAADPEVAQVSPAQKSPDGAIALLTLVPKHAPEDAQVSDLLHRLRDKVVPAAESGTGNRVYVGGVTAFNADLADAVGERLPWMILAVLVAAFVLLLAMFRAPIVSLKAVVMVLLSIGASFGVLTAIFQWGWGLSLVGLERPIPILSMVPMLLFAVLFGLSMDYEVFMLTSIKEEYDASGDAEHAVQAGLASVARVITAAAAIMSLVFLSFVPISDPTLKMIGIGLVVAVIVDVTVIRLILAPAVLSILGDTAWRGFGLRRSVPVPRPKGNPSSHSVQESQEVSL